MTKNIKDGLVKHPIHLCLIDRFIGLSVLITCSPIMLLVTLLIKFDSSGTPFFSQKRLGHNENEFSIYKFRTMRLDAEKNGPQWAVEDDERTTKLGDFLRKCHLDELPQAINLIKGDIALVGPRPIRRHYADILIKEDDRYHRRFLVKPGITGWAQIYAPYGSTISEQLEKIDFDMRYLHEKLTLFTYLKVALLTSRLFLTKTFR